MALVSATIECLWYTHPKLHWLGAWRAWVGVCCSKHLTPINSENQSHFMDTEMGVPGRLNNLSRTPELVKGRGEFTPNLSVDLLYFPNSRPTCHPISSGLDVNRHQFLGGGKNPWMWEPLEEDVSGRLALD